MPQTLADTAVAAPVSTQDAQIASGPLPGSGFIPPQPSNPDVLPGAIGRPAPITAPSVGVPNLGDTMVSSVPPGARSGPAKPPSTFAERLGEGFKAAVQELKPGPAAFNKAVMASALSAMASPNGPIANIGDAGTGDYNPMTGIRSNKGPQQVRQENQAALTEDQLKRAQTQYYQTQAVDLHAKAMREEHEANKTDYTASIAAIDKARSEGREVIELPGASAADVANPEWKKAHPEYGDIMKDYVHANEWTPELRYSVDPKNPNRYIPDGIYLVHVPSADWNKTKPTETDFKGDKNYDSNTNSYAILAPVPGQPGKIQTIGHRDAASISTGADLALLRASNAAVVSKQNDELQKEQDKQASLEIARDRVQEVQVTEARNVFDKAFPQGSYDKTTGKYLPPTPVNDADRSALVAQYNNLVDPENRITVMNDRPISQATGLLFGLDAAKKSGDTPSPETVREFYKEYGDATVKTPSHPQGEAEYIHALEFAGYANITPYSDAQTPINISTDLSKLSDTDYLEALKKQDIGSYNQVVAIGEGREDLPNARTKVGQALSEQVTQAFPTYDVSKGQTWGKARNEFFGSGKTAAGLNSLNTALEHMQALYETSTMAGLNNPLSKEYSQRKIDLTLVSEELGKAVKNGVATEGEVKELEAGLTGARVGAFGVGVAAPDNAKAAIGEAAKRLYEKLQNYQVQVANAKPIPSIQTPSLITSQAQASYKTVTGTAPTINGGTVPPGSRPIIKDGQTVGHITPDGKRIDF